MFSVEELAEAVGGKLLKPEPREIKGFSIDSRNLNKGDFFIPLSGSKTDGHHFIEDAYDKGASGTFIGSKDFIQEDFFNVILVDDTEHSLLKSAESYRSRFEIPIVGVTGSWGKTTSKELIASVLSESGDVHKSPGNYNTEYGLPLSLLEMGEEVDYGVFELGLQYPGDVEKLSKVLSPTIGLITGVGKAHFEHFRSVREIAREKLKLVTGMETEARVLINADSDPLREEVELKNKYEFIRYGREGPDRDYYATDVTLRGVNGLKFKLNSAERTGSLEKNGEDFSLLLESRLNSKANLYNILGASASSLELGVSASDLKEGVDISPLPHRLDLIEFYGGLIIDDTYNANPAATVNALEILSDIDVEGRRIFVFGDMKELGEDAADHHREIGPDVSKAGVDLLLAVGELTKALVEEMDSRRESKRLPAAEWFESKTGLLNRLDEELRGEDNLILVKGSRSMEMEEVVDFLVA